MWHDMVQGTIITSYCLQGQLLISHLHFLRVKLLQHTVPGIEWMKVFFVMHNNHYVIIKWLYHASFSGNKRVQEVVKIFQ